MHTTRNRVDRRKTRVSCTVIIDIVSETMRVDFSFFLSFFPPERVDREANSYAPGTIVHIIHDLPVYYSSTKPAPEETSII